MNTPAHVIASALLLGRGRWRNDWGPITLGALLPDLPMLGFYVYQRFGQGLPESYIWSVSYFEPGWQALFDVFNSLPLIGLLAALAWATGASRTLALAASMILHCLADLPLHTDDAHAHFYPLSNWHYHSPVSYWDPRSHGQYVVLAELLLVVAGSVALMRRPRSTGWRAVGIVTLALYAAYVGFALWAWGYDLAEAPVG